MCTFTLPSIPMPGSGGLPALPIMAYQAMLEDVLVQPDLDGLPISPPSPPTPPMPGFGGLPANPLQTLIAMAEDYTSRPDLDGLPIEPPSPPSPPALGSGGLPANPLQMIQGIFDMMTPPACPTE
jgi:hypothetical protein